MNLASIGSRETGPWKQHLLVRCALVFALLNQRLDPCVVAIKQMTCDFSIGVFLYLLGKTSLNELPIVGRWWLTEMLDPQVIDLRHRHCAQASDLGQHTRRRLVSRALRAFSYR